MNKKERQKLILEIVNQYHFKTQKDVWETLKKDHRVKVHLATVHRDLKELGLDTDLDLLSTDPRKYPIREKKRMLYENLIAVDDVSYADEMETLIINSSYNIAPMIALQLEDVFSEHGCHFCAFATPVGKIVVHYSKEIEKDFLAELGDIFEGNYNK